MIKLMKGDKKFREQSKSNLQCSNEIYIYKTVIPFFQKFVGDNVKSIDTFNWIPRIYYAEKGVYPELSDDEETILVMENLKYSGYRLGPKIDLDENHLRLMTKNIAKYHSVTYALRIVNEVKLPELIDGIKPLRFLNEKGEIDLETNNVWFKIAMPRLFKSVEELPEEEMNPKLIEEMKKFQMKFGDEPIRMMEKLLVTDELSVIQHGDYYRNNVLFKYENENDFENPMGMKMFDFQVVLIQIYKFSKLYYS